MRPRTVELGLLFLATLVTGVAYGLTSLARTASLPTDILPFGAMVVGLLLAAHVAIRRFAPRADGLLLPLAALLNGLGYVMIARLDPELADNQSAWTLLGLVAFVAVLIVVRDVRSLAAYRYSFGLLGVALLLLPLVPGLGVEINGARIWLHLGPFSIQPGELAKVVLAMFLAGYLIDKREVLSISTRKLGPLPLPQARHFAPLLVAWGVALVVMVAERDLGSSLLFFTLFLVMVYCATARVAYVVIGFGLFAVGAVVAWTQFTHVQQRVDIWLHPFADPKGSGYQIVEASFGLADGGVSGTGLGLGTPGKVPFAATDMIFAALGEELGLMGAVIVLASFVMLMSAGFRVAMQTGSAFEAVLAAGLTALVGFQAFIIVAGVLRVLPLTGVTLPFVSYGGSSLISNYLILALLVRISDRAAQPPKRPEPQNAVESRLVGSS